MNDQDAMRKAYPNLLGFLEREVERWNDIEVMNIQLEADNDRLKEQMEAVMLENTSLRAELDRMVKDKEID